MPDALSTAHARRLDSGLIVWPSSAEGPQHHPDANILVAKFLCDAGDSGDALGSLSVMRSTKFVRTPTGWSVQETLELEDGDIVCIADAAAVVPDPSHRIEIRRVTTNSVPDLIGRAQLYGRARDWSGCGACLPGKFYKSTEVLGLYSAGGALVGHLIRSTSIRFGTGGRLADCSVVASFTEGNEPLVLEALDVPEAVAPSARTTPAEIG